MTQLPHVLKRIRLNLARSKEFPHRVGHGTAMNSWRRSMPPGTSIPSCGGSTASIAACAGSGRARTTRSAAWCTSRAATSMRAGSSTTTRAPKTDDEAGYRFGNHVFRNGEYVSIRDEDGEMHTFQVVSVEPAT